MSPKYVILKTLIYIINEHSQKNITLLHYIKSSSYKYFFGKEFFILLKTDDSYHAGKVFEIAQDNENDYFLYEEIPFNYTDEKYYYNIDDLIIGILKRFKKYNIKIDYKTSSLVRKNYTEKWIKVYCNLCDNYNYLKEMNTDQTNI